MKAVAIAVLAALMTCAALPSLADVKKAATIPSSYAPQKPSKNRVYGAPIQPPIMGHRKSAHNKAGHSKTHAAKASKKARGTKSAKNKQSKKKPKASSAR